MRFRFDHLICILAMLVLAGCGKSTNEKRLEAELAAATAKLAEVQPLLQQSAKQLAISTKQLGEFSAIVDSRSLGTLEELTKQFTSGAYDGFTVSSVTGETTMIKNPKLALVISLISKDGQRVSTAQIMMAGSTQKEDEEFEKIGHLVRFPVHFDASTDTDLVLDMLHDVSKNKKLGLIFMRFAEKIQIDSYGMIEPEFFAVRVRRRADHEKMAEF